MRRTRTGVRANAVYVRGPGCRRAGNVPAAEVLSANSAVAAGMPKSAKNAEEKGLYYAGGAVEAGFIVTKLALTAVKRVVLSAHLVEEPVGDDELRYKWI